MPLFGILVFNCVLQGSRPLPEKKEDKWGDSLDE
jgi:hypothetical protein